MTQVRLRASVIAVLLVLSLFVQGTRVLAETTGTLSGTVTDVKSGKSLPGVTVTATSPSQTSKATTDRGGHFNFLSLAPDTYTLSSELQGYESRSEAGVTVQADNTRVVSLQIGQALRTIARVTSRSAGNLVRPGTTADVYSINSAQSATVAAAGGGGNLDSAFSALSTVPGVAVAPGQSGYIGAGATLSIRGGDYDQIGYQLDGIPVNRAFDNYPSGSTSSLGQQELQVYTGSPPAGATSEGISGYINQVIKTGTNPGYVSSDLGIGGPTYYHKANFEAGGTALNNRFSYYVGVGGYNQTQRYVDQFDGASLSRSYGVPYGLPCTSSLSEAVTPSCYVNGKFTPQGLILGPSDLFAQSGVDDRDTIGNVHYYFPHNDGSRDDIQLLFYNDALRTRVYNSVNDQGGVGFLQTLNTAVNGAPAVLPNGKPNTGSYLDGYQLNLPTGGFLPTNYRQYASIYSFPNVDTHTFNDQINPAIRDGFLNDQSVEKVQFTKSLGSSAFARVYGYSYYSDWLNSGPQSVNFAGNFGIPSDYELSSHSRGAGFTISDQLNPQNLLSLTGDYTTSNLLRSNNTEFFNGAYAPDTVNARTAIGILVDSSNPTNGVCYDSTGTATNCFTTPTRYNATGAQFATLQQAYNGTVAPITAASCGGGACKYLVVGNGQYATFNTVKPNFFGAALSDEIRPSSKLTINAGIRLDDYQYVGANTSGGPARAFYYAAYNREMCQSLTTGLLKEKVAQLNQASPTSLCPSGYSAINLQNPSGSVTQTYPEFQPRLGFTYSLTPNTVLRASYGRYTQPPNSAFEQYDTLQSNSPSTLYGTYGFQQFGFTSPNHPIPPAASNNYDFSIEQGLPGQVSLKLTPFLRKTQNQIQQFFLNRATSFVSGLNVGNQTSSGFEFEADKGDFSRDGLSAKLSFAYTNSYIKYNVLSNGSTVLTPVVDAINQYNSFTKAGGGSPCYTQVVTAKDGSTSGGTPVAACAAGDVANPYYNAPQQNANAFNASQNYIPYDTIPAGIGVSAVQYGYPYVASLVLNEKIKRFSVAPIVQLFAGERYGSPLATNGIDPTTCGAVLGGTPTGDPRYNFGAAGGSPYDASSCAGQLGGGIPNVQSGAFDGLGAYVEPAQILMHLQASYQVSKNFTLTANLANLVNTCVGGSNVPWKVAGACGYGLVQTGLTGGIGNTYNPGDAIQPAARYSYGPFWLQQPFGAFVNASVRL